MEVLKKPELNPLQTGGSLKTIQVTTLAGMVMPSHHTTKEAVIVVQQGEAILKMPDTEHLLREGSSFIIPAHVDHSLEVKTDFKAIAIMAIDSDIEFQK